MGMLYEYEGWEDKGEIEAESESEFESTVNDAEAFGCGPLPQDIEDESAIQEES